MRLINFVPRNARRWAATLAVVAAVLAGVASHARPAAADSPPAPLGLPVYQLAYVDLTIGTTYIKDFQNGPSLLFEVKNVGNVNSKPFWVAVKSGGGVVLEWFNLPGGIVAGGTVLLFHHMPDCPPTGGEVRTIVADASYVVNELKENNNTHTAAYSYLGDCIATGFKVGN